MRIQQQEGLSSAAGIAYFCGTERLISNCLLRLKIVTKIDIQE
jgi:hypothetical protein